MTEAVVIPVGLLVGRRALVIGAGRGIGRAVALALAGTGADVVVADNDAGRADEVAAEVRALGRRARPLVLDVLDDGEVEAAIELAAAAFGGLDVLVTVVGGQGAFAPFQPLHETPVATLDLIQNINIRYVFVAVRATVQVMMAQGTGGTIVSVGAISGLTAAPGHAAYGAAKAGLANLAKTVAGEYGRFGVRMNVVAPGSVATPAVAEQMTADELQALHANVPLGRAAIAEEIAATVVFLASPMSSYVTGQHLSVDGGATLQHPFAAFAARPAEEPA